MSSKRHTIGDSSCSPVIIQIPGIQGTGITWETMTEKEKQEISDRILSPVVSNAENAAKSEQAATAAKDRAEKLATDVDLVVGDYQGYMDEHFSHDFGVWGDDDTQVRVPIGGSIQAIADIATEVKAVGANIDSVVKAADGIDQIGTILPYADSLNIISPYIEDVHEVATVSNEVSLLSKHTATIQALAGTVGLTAEATTLAPGKNVTVAKTTTSEGYKLTFGIPRGDKGETGERGPQGIQGIKGDQGNKGDKGDTGNPGVYVGTETPEDYYIYIDPTEEQWRDYYTKTEADTLLEEIKDRILKMERIDTVFGTSGCEFVVEVDSSEFIRIEEDEM